MSPKFRILVAEDDENQRFLYVRELTAAGYSVQTAATGREAFDRFTVDPPDLAILDIRMPGMDGIALMALIIARDRRIPVILHSAYACYRDNYLSWAADAYLIKSSDLSELKLTISALLSSRSDDKGRFVKASGERNHSHEENACEGGNGPKQGQRQLVWSRD